MQCICVYDDRLSKPGMQLSRSIHTHIGMFGYVGLYCIFLYVPILCTRVQYTHFCKKRRREEKKRRTNNRIFRHPCIAVCRYIRRKVHKNECRVGTPDENRVIFFLCFFSHLVFKGNLGLGMMMHVYNIVHAQVYRKFFVTFVFFFFFVFLGKSIVQVLVLDM